MMIEFIASLKSRNELLFYFGLINFTLAGIFLVMSIIQQLEVAGANAWYKPLKFALSIGIFSWSMGWYTYYLAPGANLFWYHWAIIILLGFEIFYISLQAGRGQLSHFNSSSPFYASMYVMMALAATIVTLWTAYIGYLFFVREFPGLSGYYLWSIRLGILIFVIFSLEGFVMGSRLSHTIGGPDGEAGLPFLNWSTKYGDPRISHFIGMHALQILPLASFYIIKNTQMTLAFACLYFILAIFTLFQALQGQPFYKKLKIKQDETIAIRKKSTEEKIW